MAITTTLFSQFATTSELMTWLKTTVEGYGFFDTITVNAETNTITFTVDNVDFTSFTFTNNTISGTITFISKSGITDSYNATTKPLIGVVTTSKVIRFITADGGYYGVIFDKTANGRVCVWHQYGKTPHTISIDNITNSFALSSNIRCSNSNITTISNAPVLGGIDIMQNTFLIIACENTTAGNYTLNGNNYYSDGYVMIAD